MSGARLFVPDTNGVIAGSEAAEDAIRGLVFTFYSRVQEDALLAPVFERTLHGRWGGHLKLMCDFWSGVVLGSGRYRGDPVRAHTALRGIRQIHFTRWMELFEETAQMLLDPSDAREIVGRARRIRAVLEHHVVGADNGRDQQ